MRSIRNCGVCVVGGAGFLGSHLVNHLVEDRECDVLVIDNLLSGRPDFIHPKAKFEHHDICGSEGQLLKLFRHHNIEFVFNYAAEPYIPVSFERPLHVFNINAFGALKVINAAQDAMCEGILQISSAEIYGNCGAEGAPGGPIDESFPVVPHSSYGAAKAAIDAIVQVRWREAQTPVIALRQFNCIGERDETHPYVIPEIILQIHHNGPCVQLGNNSFRDFLYAGDQAKMAAELLEKGRFGEVYNLGSEQGVHIYDLAQMVGELMGHDKVNVIQDTSRMRPWEIWHLQSDNAKINAVIEARPEVDLPESLNRTIRYFVENNWRLAWWEHPS